MPSEATPREADPGAPPAFAVVASGGKQHRVVVGETVRLERLAGAPGDDIAFTEVLMVGAGEAVRVGQPLVAGAVVRGELIDQGRHKKIRVVKFKRRKNYLRRRGHRQRYSDVRVTAIDVDAPAEPPATTPSVQDQPEAADAPEPPRHAPDAP